MSKTGDEEDEDECFYESLDRIVSSSCSCSTSNSDSDQEPDDDGRGGGELQAVGAQGSITVRQHKSWVHCKLSLVYCRVRNGMTFQTTSTQFELKLSHQTG
ncbi:hypothetical protein TIFTF001_005882 [Ficus carica]|uniref:Uncharacterized protein n=1 Tax=Ficus carica TaxID=3494 RepID=A0AA87ZN03_FICCA|nr:hypothetical protein TIFTF001_005882 [Ficus carica]